MPLFRTGRVFNPYAADSSASKKRRLEATGDLLTALGAPEVSGLLHEAADIVDSTGEQIVPESQLGKLSFPTRSSRESRRGMASRMKFARNRRFKRRFKRKRQSENSRTFRRVVRWKESKQIVLEPATATLTAGDGTTRTLRLFNPWQVLAQGDTSATREGSTIFARGFALSLFFADVAANAANYEVVITYFKSPMLTDTTASLSLLDDRGLTYGNTTTATANPTQGTISGTVNLPMYDDTNEPFVGDDPASGLNPQFVKVIKRWRFPFRSDGVAGSQPFKVVRLWCPLNRIMSYEHVEATEQAGQFWSGGFQYYYSIAVVAADFAAATDLCTMVKNTTLYWKEW